ncbi:MAG: aminotransferase class IV [Patescibacteria group bacterium]|jgi:branched-subunit amino acid aminotransferase/4-amino-4-deoxychorismate lyase
MEFKYAIKNGELIEKEKANVSIYNKPYFFDFCVYSNIKVVQGKMFMPEVEIDRLFASAGIIGLQHPFAKEKIRQWVSQLIEKNNITDALIRLLLIGPDKENEALLFLFPVGLTFYRKEWYKDGAKLITFHGERFMPTAKVKSLFMSYMGYSRAQEQGAYDALLIDRDGNITEGTRSSFFVIKGDVLIAPPAEKVLVGATRTILMKIAPKILKVKEADIPLAEIKNFDEYFVTGTSVKIMPVRQIDDILLINKASEKIKQLSQTFREYCAN